MKIVCIGDSIVKGFPFAEKNSWPSLIAKDTGWEMINMGINGDDSGHVLYRFEMDALSFKPDKVIILTGANDFVFGLNGPKKVAENITGMVDKALAQNVEPILCSPILTDPELAPVKWAPGDYNETNRQIQELRKLLGEIAAAKNVQLLDPLPAYQEYAEYKDGVHPTKEGYRLLADYIRGELE